MSEFDVGKFNPELAFRLRCGRNVRVTAFAFEATYAGLLEGWPREQTTKDILEHHLSAASRRMTLAALIYLVPPKMDPVPPEVLQTYENSLRGLQHLFARPPAATLPPVQCLADLLSEAIDGNYDGSHLKVLWFQKPFFDRALNKVLGETLQDIPWLEKARDFSY